MSAPDKGEKLEPIAQIRADQEWGIGSIPLRNKVRELIDRINLLARRLEYLSTRGSGDGKL